MNLNKHPLNDFSSAFAKLFARKIIAKKAVGITELEGKVFEQILCEIYGIDWKGSNNGLTDVFFDGLGYSVKSLLYDRPYQDKKGEYRRVSTIVGRNSPDTHDGSHIEKNSTDASKAGEIVVNIWNDRLKDAIETCQEFRQLTILKSKDLCNWLLFETTPQFFDYRDFKWEWKAGKGKGKKSINLYGRNDIFGLTWQPNGSQFTLNYQIPKKHLKFKLSDAIPIISEQKILEQIGLDDDWIKIL